MKAHGGCGCKDAHTYVYTAMALGKGRVASPMLGHLYPRYSFYSRLSGPQEQSGYEGVKRISTPSDTQDRTWAVETVAKCLVA